MHVLRTLTVLDGFEGVFRSIQGMTRPRIGGEKYSYSARSRPRSEPQRSSQRNHVQGAFKWRVLRPKRSRHDAQCWVQTWISLFGIFVTVIFDLYAANQAAHGNARLRPLQYGVSRVKSRLTPTNFNASPHPSEEQGGKSTASLPPVSQSDLSLLPRFLSGFVSIVLRL
jgi:hypothetical protein